jgi:Right handed beta helix region
MTPPFQPTVTLDRAVFNACYALCQMAGTQLPDDTKESTPQIQKRGCDAIQVLQAAGIPNSAAVTAQINAAIATLSASLAPVAFTGDYDDLTNKPTLGVGTVTSVALALPAPFTNPSPPVTGAGILTMDFPLANDKIFIGVGNVPTAVTVNIYNIVAYGASSAGSAASNHTAIANAIAAAVAAGGGTIYTPKGTFTTTEVTVASSVGLTFLFADRYSSIWKASVNTAPVLTITGSNVTIKGGGFDGAYVSGASSDVGIIAITGATNVAVTDCRIFNAKGNCVRMRGAFNNVRITGSELGNYFCGISALSDTVNSSGVVIDGCIVTNGWGTGAESGAIKLQSSNGSVATGHRVSNSTIGIGGQMGVEYWGYVTDSTISNCKISGVEFGTSFCGVRRSSVTNCEISLFTYAGIEVACDSSDIATASNVIDGFDSAGTTRTGDYGIISSGTPQNVSHTGNKIKGCESSGYAVYGSTNVDILGGSVKDCGGAFDIKGSSYITVKAVELVGPFAGAFFWIETWGSDVTDIEIAGCTLNGHANYNGLQLYSGDVAKTMTNVLVKDNNIQAATCLYYGISESGLTGKLFNFNVVRNIAVAAGMQWPDSSTDPFAPGIQEFSIPIANKFTFTVPASGADQWYKIFSRTFGFPFNLALHVKCQFQTADNTASDQTFWVAGAPYGLDCNIMKIPDTDYSGGSLKEIIYDNPSNYETQEIWLRFPPTGGGTVTVGGADFASNWITAPTQVTTEPTWASNHYKLDALSDHNALFTPNIKTDQLNIAASGYANFGTTRGTTGYGFRDNAGTAEVKNSGGGWAAIVWQGITRFLLTAASPSTNEGDIYNDSGQTKHGSFTNGLAGWFERCIWSGYAAVTHTGVVTSQSMFTGTAKGTRSLPANFWKAGKAIRVRLQGNYTTDAVPGNATIEIKFGATTYRTTGSFALDANVTTGFWTMDFVIVCETTGVTGTLNGACSWVHAQATGGGSQPMYSEPFTTTAPVTVNTTSAATFDCLWTATDAGTVCEITTARIWEVC